MKLALKLSGLAMLCTCLTGCMGTYLINSAYQQMKLLAQRESIEDILKKDKVKPKIRKKLLLAQEARLFAEKKLGLKPTQNYTSYVDIGRPYVTYIVRVAKTFELEPKNWWYPIVGELPYKGYFSKEGAIEEAKSFDPNVYDTYVRGASAYSTLGWFNDPILSSMMSYRDHQLVNLVIHETVHATIYIKGHANFNERLATFLGNKGTELFYLEKEGINSPTLKRIKEANKDSEMFSTFISQELKQLKIWYKDNSKNINKEKKALRLSEIQARFSQDILPQMKVYKYRSFMNSKLNNAQLLSLSTYVQDLSDFQTLLDKMNGSFKDFLAYCKILENKKDPMKTLKEEIGQKDAL